MVTTEQASKQASLVWKCCAEGCKYTAAPTVEGYRKLSGHQLAHTGVPKAKRGFQLVDETTGEILAQKLEEAIAKGFIASKPPAPMTNLGLHPATGIKQPEPEAERPEPEAEPEAEPEIKPEEEATRAEIVTVKTAGTFKYEITLPADAFTLFNLAKACGLEPNGDKLFDEWIWDCVRARFSKDYKKQLILAPVEE